MTSTRVDLQEGSAFLLKSSLYITAVSAIFLTPFAVNNFVQGRMLLGLGAGAIVLICAINIWVCLRGRYLPQIIFFGLAPTIIVFLWFAFRDLGVIGALWSYPAAMSFYFMLPERYAWLANAILLGCVVPEAFNSFDQPVAIRYVVTFTTTSLFAGVFVRYITSQQRELAALAVTDVLTGLLNRSRLQIELERAIQRNHRTGSPETILMMDLDHFKSINDTLGHAAGDKVLRAFGDYLQRRIRVTDLVFRMGGEEFLALLVDTDGAIAANVAEEIRAEVQKLPELSHSPVTVSIGVAQLGQDENVEAWLKRADAKLYSAKAAGRNRVVV